ncbi:MAG: hypothetical protein AAF528_00190 [Cyanobacteria bacterium P01_C01_bin.121]
MSFREEVNFTGLFVNYNGIFDEKYVACIGFAPNSGRYAGYFSDKETDETIFHTGLGVNRNYSFEQIFHILHSKLNRYGLEGFPTDPEYIKQILEDHPPKIVDLGMTDEEYLRGLEGR